MVSFRVVSVLLMGASIGDAKQAWPRFSWDTVPVFFHSCNFSGPYTDDAIAIMAKFPMVTIEKGQGVVDAHDSRPAEDKIVSTLQRVKNMDSNVSTIFYYNSLMDWSVYHMHEEFQTHPDWHLKDADGEDCKINGDPLFPDYIGMLLFDFRNSDAREFWASECVNMTRTGYVDGCFSDRAVDDPPKYTQCDIDDEWREGHTLVHQDLQREIGESVLIANHAYDMEGVNAVQIENFTSSEESILELMDCVANGKITQARAGMSKYSEAENCSDLSASSTLAAFLIGAGERSYYQCILGWNEKADPIAEVWRPEYDRPLGKPTGPAVKNLDEYRREFVNPLGTTVVTFNTSSNTGFIAWSDASDVALVQPLSRDSEALAPSVWC